MPIKIDLKVKPSSGFDIPYNEGYQLYSALLNLTREENEELSEKIHDEAVGNLNIGKLDGPFGDGVLDYHKAIYENAEYDLSVSVTDTEEEEIFKTFFKSLILDEKAIPLDKGDLLLREMESSNCSYEEIIEEAQDKNPDRLKFCFLTPTNIEYRNSNITEMFPHRNAVFNSLVSKWNRKVEDKLKIGLDRETIGKSLIEYPEFDSLNSYSVKVGNFYNEKKNHEQPILKQGFKGECEYRLSSKVSEEVKNALTCLTIFAEFSGVGSAVSRGCGSVKTEVNG